MKNTNMGICNSVSITETWVTEVIPSFIFQQNEHKEQHPLPWFTTVAAGPGVHLQIYGPATTPSPASGFHSLLTSRRSAGPAGSSPPAVTTLTTALARVHSRWGATSKPPTMPRCALSCTHSNSPVMWGRPAASLKNSSPSAYCTSMTRRTWFWSSMTTWWHSAVAVTDWLCASCTFKDWDRGWQEDVCFI